MSEQRLEAFGDGAIAIAITLLVLEIGVPKPGEEGLAHALAEQCPAYAAYVVSFLTVGIIWMNHHAVIEHLRGADRTLLLLNLLLLGWVALIPWPTNLIAEYMREGGGDEQVAALVYAGTMAGMGVSFGALWRYATSGRRLIGDAVSDQQIRSWTMRFTLGAPVYVLAMLAALVSAPVSLLIVGALALYYALPAGGAIPHPEPTRSD